MRSAAIVLWAAGLLDALAPAAAAEPVPLRVVIYDGDVAFQGDNLDIDTLRARLSASGRQNERLYFQVGPNAKSVYISRVLRAVHAAGFSQVVIVGPDGTTEIAPPERPMD